jgi:hypothetical protein
MIFIILVTVIHDLFIEIKINRFEIYILCHRKNICDFYFLQKHIYEPLEPNENITIG